VVLAATILAPCLSPASQSAAGIISVPVPDNGGFAPAPMDLCESSEHDFLSGEIFGALKGRIEWRGPDMKCGGMLRPDADGIRLVFAASREGEELLFVLGINGTLDELAGGEHKANITIVDETHDRFFSTGRRERCWSKVESITAVTDRVMQVAGEFYCAGSLPSLSDNSSVTLRDMRYSGRLLLDESTLE
jgi:hypothetical protein